MESERQVRRRRRPAYSCVQCRSRKIKCDRQSPCSHCVAAKITCVYRTFRDSPSISDPEARSGAQARQSRAGSTNSAVTSSPKSASLADAAALGGPVGSDLGLGDSPRCPLQPDESLRLPPIVVDHNGNTRWTHGSLSHRTQASSSVSVTSAPTSPHIPNPIQSGLLFKKSRIFRWTDWMGTAKEVGLRPRVRTGACVLSRAAAAATTTRLANPASSSSKTSMPAWLRLWARATASSSRAPRPSPCWRSWATCTSGARAWAR